MARRASRWSVRSVAVGMVVSGLVLGACSTSGSSGDDAGATNTEASTSGADAELLASLAISDDDLRKGERWEDRAQGTEVGGQVTLDYCGAAFPSELLRAGRHQVNLVAADGTTVASNEAVSYDDGGARQAVDEMRGAFIDCRDGEYVESAVEGVPALRYDAFPLMEDDLTDVADDHVAARITYQEEGGEPATTYAVYQRRGDVMIATYGVDEARVLELANAAGRRLAAADGGAVGD